MQSGAYCLIYYALAEFSTCEKSSLVAMLLLTFATLYLQELCSAIAGVGKKIDPAIKNGMQWLVDSINKDWEELSVRVEKDMEEQKEKDRQEKERKREKARKIREER